MGSCVSVHKNPDSAMKIQITLGSKAKKLFIPSPSDEKPCNGENQISELNFKHSSSSPRVATRDFGSKEESFFDTQAWLESDCEDDFLSVNGDFTPSYGNTPNYQSSASGTPQLNKSLLVDQMPNSKPPEPSPTDRKKKLADLFRESLQEEKISDNQNVDETENMGNEKLEVNKTNLHLPPKSSNVTPHLSRTNSACNSERTPNKEKAAKSAAQCCLPNFIPSISFNERKKQLSPERHNIG
eukprot:TRINITY_DN442_c0_g1_i1.p1 TRINITY_DN442_c0_g1~~TRINITY_DN442_c0_g1_i1.p1  ORF type:complete len:241 (+),score=38.21 TRINITY_DN442_c0_g1_i1:118-840(+)